VLSELESLAIGLDPSLMMEALGFDPDDWQRDYLRSDAENLLLLCHRQSGKSSATAALALTIAPFEPDSLILLLSPSLRQSGELFRKVTDGYEALGRPVPTVEDSSTTLALANGSRVVCLPGSAATVRGYSGPRLVVIDEASRANDELLAAVSPMLAVSRGRLVLLSTPYGKRGFFYENWSNDSSDWERIKFTAPDNPRIDPEWLERERLKIGERMYQQEYLCEFVETDDQLFSEDVISAMFTSDKAPLFGVGG
jgi:hypothetical protein